MFDNLMYLLLCISIDINKYQGGVQGKGMAFRPSIVFVHKKGMVLKVRHGLCTKKGHGLWGQAWSVYRERAWLTSSGMVLLYHSILHSYVLFFLCLGSHHDYCFSGIVCAFIVAFFFSWEIVISIKMKRYAIYFSPDCSDFG